MANSGIQGKFFSGLFWVLLLNLLVKPLWIFGIEVGVQNAVGAASYGFYFSIFNLAVIFNILLDLGITNYNTRNIARHPQLLGKHLSHILSIKVLLLFVYVVATFTIGALLGYDSHQFYILAFLCFNQFLNSLLLYLRSNYEGLLLFKWDSVLSVMDRVLMIVICGALLFYSSHGAVPFAIEWFVYAQTVAYLVTVVFAFVVLVRRVGVCRLRWHRPFALLMLRRSAPFALLVLLMASYNRLDPILLSLLLPDGDTAAGVYASAFRLLDALTMIAYLVSVPLLPVYARLTHRYEPVVAGKELGDVTRLSFSLLQVFAITAAVGLAFVASPLMQLLYVDHTAESADVFAVVVFCIIPISLTYIFGTLLTAGGHLRQLNILASVALTINVGANVLFIPRYGAVGSAWASLAAQSFMAVAQMIVAMRIYSMCPSASYVLRFVLFIVAVVGSNMACASLTLPWLWQLAFAAVLSLLAAVLLRLIDFRAMLSLLAKRG